MRKRGGVREHLYYRCANNDPGPDHPTVRWKAEDLQQAIVDDLAMMRMPTAEVAKWFRSELLDAVTDITRYRRQQAASLGKRKTELVTMQGRPLNAYLGGTVVEEVYTAKSHELRSETAKTDEALEHMGNVDSNCGETAVTLFDWTQRAGEIWRGSNNAVRREILDAVCLNRRLGDLTLVTTKRKPFDVFAETAILKNSRGDRI